VDAPTVSCKVVENCHLKFLQDIHPDQLSEVKKGYKGIRDPSNPGSPTHLAQDVADAAVWMLTLLLNEKPTSAMEVQARAEGLPVQTWVYSVSCNAGKKYNHHLCDILLTPAGFANLKQILAKVAHTNLGALFNVQKKGTKTVATPFSSLWFSSTFTRGSMFRKSKTPVAKPQKQTSIVNFLSHPKQAASEAASILPPPRALPRPQG